MYLTLTWSPLNGTTKTTIEAEIFAAISAFKFVHTFISHDGVFHASILKGETLKQVQLLCNKLLETSDDRYTFVITISANSQTLWRSRDMTAPSFATMVKYVT